MRVQDDGAHAMRTNDPHRGALRREPLTTCGSSALPPRVTLGPARVRPVRKGSGLYSEQVQRVVVCSGGPPNMGQMTRRTRSKLRLTDARSVRECLLVATLVVGGLGDELEYPVIRTPTTPTPPPAEAVFGVDEVAVLVCLVAADRAAGARSRGIPA